MEKTKGGDVMTSEQANLILKELDMLRRLKMAEFLERGYSQAQLAQILSVSQPTISRMIPSVAVKKKA